MSRSPCAIVVITLAPSMDIWANKRGWEYNASKVDDIFEALEDAVVATN
jgi:hypothetical protein